MTDAPSELHFAKLFAVDDGQVLIMLDQNDEGAPVIKFTTVVQRGISVTVALAGWPDEEAGWDRAAQAFHAMTEDDARRRRADILAIVPPLAGDADV